MAKRRVEEVESDDDDAPQTQQRKASGSKRARFDGGAPQTHEFEDDEVRADRVDRRKGKQRANANEEVDDFEKPEDRPVDEAAETQFEEEHEEEIRESIRQKQKQQGVSASLFPIRIFILI